MQVRMWSIFNNPLKCVDDPGFTCEPIIRAIVVLALYNKWNGLLCWGYPVRTH